MNATRHRHIPSAFITVSINFITVGQACVLGTLEGNKVWHIFLWRFPILNPLTNVHESCDEMFILLFTMHFLKGTPHQETLISVHVNSCIKDVKAWSLLVYFLCLPWYVLTPWGLPTCRTRTCTSCPETVEVKQQWSVDQDQVMQMSPRAVRAAHAQVTPYQLRDRGFVLCCSDKSIGAPPARL